MNRNEVTLTERQIHMANDLFLFTITTSELCPAQYEIRDKGLGQGAWLGHTCKALSLYEKTLGIVDGMKHSFVLMQAAHLIEDHHKS